MSSLEILLRVLAFSWHPEQMLILCSQQNDGWGEELSVEKKLQDTESPLHLPTLQPLFLSHILCPVFEMNTPNISIL